MKKNLVKYLIRKGIQEDYHKKLRYYHERKTTLKGQNQIEFAKKGKLEIQLEFDIDERTFHRNLIKYIQTLYKK